MSRTDKPLHRVTVCVDLPEDEYLAFQREGHRLGVSVESLVEQTVQGLLREAEHEEELELDHPVIPS
jgi:hypothetical protein